MTINQIKQVVEFQATPHRHQPQIQQTKDEGQTGQALESPQMAALQVKAMPFEIAKHLLDPHTTTIQANSSQSVGWWRGTRVVVSHSTLATFSLLFHHSLALLFTVQLLDLNTLIGLPSLIYCTTIDHFF